MAEIFGISSTSIESQTLSERLLSSLRVTDHSNPTLFRFDHGMIGSVSRLNPTEMLWISEDRKYVLAIIGAIYLPDGERLRHCNVRRDFLTPFQKAGGAFLRELNGGFCFALMGEDECTLANDPFGNYMLHYTVTKDLFAFSSQMMPLRVFAPSASFDDIGLLQHLGISQSLNGRTLFDGIKRVLRGTILTYSKATVRSEEYITRRFHPSANIDKEMEIIHGSLSNSIDGIIHSGNRVTAALSGGFDTRMTWSIILGNQSESQVTASTHGLPNSRDLLVSNRIADRLGLKKDILEFDGTILQELPELWREFVILTEGLYPLSQIHEYYAFKNLSGRFDTLIDSSGGPLYRRQIKKFIEPRIDPKENLPRQVLPFELTALATSSLIRTEVAAEMRGAALHGLKEYYDTIDDVEEIGDRFDLFYADQTFALRDSVAANLQSNFIGVEQPLMNLKALDAVARISGSVRRREGIHKYIIHHSYPKLETFSLDYSGYPAPYSGFSKMRLAGPGLGRVLQYAARAIPRLRSISLRRPPIDAKSVLEPALSMVKELLLSSHPNYDPLVERGALEDALIEIEAGDYRPAHAVIQLLTFRLMLDIFC